MQARAFINSNARIVVSTTVKSKKINHKLSYAKLNYPQCECGKCPKFYFNFLGVAARQSGKTYTICQMIKHWEKNKIMKDNQEYNIRTVLISPTVQANEIYKSLNSLDFDNDVYDDYSDGILLDIVADVKQRKDDFDKWLEYVEFYKKFIKIKD